MRRVSLDRAEFLLVAAELLRRRHDLRFTARGSSMSPTIEDGDAITVRALTAAAPMPGTIILYCAAGEQPVVHRVVTRRELGGRVELEVRGDAAPGPGELVNRERVLGEVVRVTHRRRRFTLLPRLLRALRSRLLDAPDRA
jgi:signal peptidase I